MACVNVHFKFALVMLRLCKDEDKIRQYNNKKTNPVNIKRKCIYAFNLSTGIIVTSKQFRLWNGLACSSQMNDNSFRGICILQFSLKKKKQKNPTVVTSYFSFQVIVKFFETLSR